MLNPVQKANLEEAARYALLSERDTGVPAALTVAQWALESSWGIAQPGNNCFGIKAKLYPEREGKQTGRQLLRTTEYFTPTEKEAWLARVPGRTAEADGRPRPQDGRIRYRCQDWFAVYPTLKDCFDAHAALLKRGKYADFLADYRERGLPFEGYVGKVAAVYATDPHYADSVLKIIAMPDVMAELGVTR